MDTLHKLLIICPLVFFAGFVDSIAGGGGIISLPAYYIAGLSPKFALGTNKFASTFGTTISVIRFAKNKKIDYYAALIASVAALVGSWLGTNLAVFVSEQYLTTVLLVAIPLLALFIIKNKNMSSEGSNKNFSRLKVGVLCVFAGLIIGAYDGFFGPGAGTFLMIFFNTIIGFELLTASGNAKVVNFSSNIASLIVYLLNGYVLFAVVVPAAVSSILGNYVGSHFAIKKGAKIIRPAFIFVLGVLFVKIGYDTFIK